MKKILIGLVVPFVAACSGEELELSNDPVIPTYKSLIDDAEAANPNNPYDTKGREYLDLSDAYEALASKPAQDSAIIGMTETLAYALLTDMDDYNPQATQNLKSLKALANADLTTAVAGLQTSNAFKSQLISCVDSLRLKKTNGAGYGEVYDVLLYFEASALNSPLSQQEKEALLTTYSIMRYSVYNNSRRKRKDRDWDLLVGNYIGIAYGAVESAPNAIVNGTLAEILN